MADIPRVLLRSEQTAGAVSLVVSSMPADGDGPLRHKHDFDEVFYILDGVVTAAVAWPGTSRGIAERRRASTPHRESLPLSPMRA